MTPTAQTSAPVVALKQRLYDINALRSAGSMMEWDQQVFMPHGGAEARGEHTSILGRMAHDTLASDETARLIEDASREVESGSDEAALVRVTKREYDIATKVPSWLVAEQLKLGAHGHEVWVKARKANDFKAFAPILSQVVELCQKQAEFLGYKENIYDALLDLYEEGATAKDVDAMFGDVRKPLVDLVNDINANGRKVDDSFLTGEWPEQGQREFTEKIVEAVGFDFNRGRQDTAHHPFCSGWSVTDIRLTTRFLPLLSSSIFSSLHEAGHGMYEQGSPLAWDRTPLAGGVSLGVHESQSRFWENIVGRSREFWQFFLPDLKYTFPALEKISLDDFHRAVNKVERSLIRVEADETTYNLHILVRYEIECGLLTGKMAVKDVPEIWNAKYKEYLGITPPSDSVGCLQDVHWSACSMGYFPTYSMGNLLSYQFLATMNGQIGDQKENWSKGKFAPTLEWLQQNIYSKGSRFSPRDLVKQVTGKPMGATDYVKGITDKYRKIYEI